MSRPAPHVYLITDRHATGGRPLLAVLAEAVRAAGAPAAGWQGAARARLAVCLRDKDLSGAALMSLAREVRALTKSAGVELYVNGRVDVALACGADGLHLPGDGFTVEDVRAIAPRLAIAASTHHANEVAAAARAGLDFVVFGPVFETPSKRAFLQARGLGGLRDVCALGIPVLALGGIDPGNARSCVREGAAGVACIRALLGAQDVASETATLLSESTRTG